MSNLTQSVIVGASAALLSTLGALWIQIIAAKITRRNQINDKRLDALVDARQKIEIAGGRWQGWAHVSITRPENEDAAERLALAGSATHDAWYAINVCELYFPSLTVMMSGFRDAIMTKRDIANKQVADNVFDSDEYKGIGPSLEELTSQGRKLLKLPKS